MSFKCTYKVAKPFIKGWHSAFWKLILHPQTDVCQEAKKAETTETLLRISEMSSYIILFKFWGFQFTLEIQELSALKIT